MLPIAARLQSLRTTARFNPGGGRVIAEAQDRNPLTQLLRAANETVLGRSLQFLSESGRSLTLDVAGRRILRLSSVDGLVGAESCLAAEVLEDEHKDDLIKLMQSVAAKGQELRVVSGPIGRGIEGVSVGLPVALLADLLLVELNEVGTGEPVEDDEGPAAPVPPQGSSGEAVGGLLGQFVDRVGSTLLAWLIIGGEDDGRAEGPDEMVSHLQGFLGDETEALSHQLDLLSDTSGGPICIMLGIALIEGHSIICARDGDGMLLAVVEGDGTKTVLKAWTAAFG
jgi:hypothetical protein